MYYFAADIHLGAGTREESRRVEERFVAWLDAAAADAEGIFLLGDVFDFWFEYRRTVPKGFVRTLAKIAELTSRGIRVVFMTGNHDMWVGDYLSTECGAEIYTQARTETLYGRKYYLAHGDNMCIGDQPALRFMNAVFRSRTLRILFSALVHPDLALRFGRWWSGKSRKAHGDDTGSGEAMSRLIRFAEKRQRDEFADGYVFGHFHSALDCRQDDLHVVFLGEWHREPAYARLTPQGLLTLEYL